MSERTDKNPFPFEVEFREIWRASSGVTVECRNGTFWQVVDKNGIVHDFESDENAAWEKFRDDETHKARPAFLVGDGSGRRGVVLEPAQGQNRWDVYTVDGQFVKSIPA